MQSRQHQGLLKTLEKLQDLHIRNDVERLMSSNHRAYTNGKSVEPALHSLVVTVERALTLRNMRLEYS